MARIYRETAPRIWVKSFENHERKDSARPFSFCRNRLCHHFWWPNQTSLYMRPDNSGGVALATRASDNRVLVASLLGGVHLRPRGIWRHRRSARVIQPAAPFQATGSVMYCSYRTAGLDPQTQSCHDEQKNLCNVPRFRPLPRFVALPARWKAEYLASTILSRTSEPVRSIQPHHTHPQLGREHML
jgi:hypothetical protein